MIPKRKVILAAQRETLLQSISELLDAVAGLCLLCPRACLKNAFCKMCITICGRFRPNEGGVAGYGNRMKAKYTVN